MCDPRGSDSCPTWSGHQHRQMNSAADCNFNPTVGVARLPESAYPLTENDSEDVVTCIKRLASRMGWSDGEEPFGAIISSGARVLVKPNLVKHINEGSGLLEPVVTHPSVIRAVVEAALKSHPAQVLVGDAPLQSCDFPVLLESLRLLAWADKLKSGDPRFMGVCDFRRTTCVQIHGIRIPTKNLRSLDHFVLFDLGRESLLEPVTTDGTFRVSNYDPRFLHRTHTLGVHQYLIAREALEADLIINLPKLKTHKKAGLTCALKNIIGINGNKEYLPHHRLGGSSVGGDCYPGKSATKHVLEYLADRENLASSASTGAVWHFLSKPLGKILRWRGDRVGADGSWSGNDTIWRTCLDLNRILLYGKTDGTMAERPQRRVIHLVDAIVAGQGNGPLAPDPLPLGLVIAGDNAVSVDWVAAYLLSFQPSDIPLLRHSFDNFRWHVSCTASSDIIVKGDLGDGAPELILSRANPHVTHPFGWPS